MKKALAIILLIIGANVVFFGLSIAVFQMLLYLGRFTIAAGFILTVGATFGISRLCGVYANRCGLSVRKFLLCAYASSAAASALFFLIAVCINAEWGWIFGLVWMIVSAAALVLGTLILAISLRLRAKKEKQIEKTN